MCFIVLFFCTLPSNSHMKEQEVNHKAPCGICKQSLRAVCSPLGAYVV